MQGSRWVIGLPAAVVALMFAAVLLPDVSGLRHIVGGNMGWTTNVNYRNWARGKHFYKGDWLFFVYDRNRVNVVEVSKGDYEKCIARRPLHNWTSGWGRDVVPLNLTKTYYFISGKGFCYRGMKVSIRVEKAPHHHL